MNHVKVQYEELISGLRWGSKTWPQSEGSITGLDVRSDVKSRGRSGVKIFNCLIGIINSGNLVDY